MRRLYRFAPFLLGLAGACSGSDEALAPTDTRHAGDACASYQDALCDWIVRCRSEAARASCEELARTIACVSDGSTEGCTAAIDAASCEAPPNDCELFDIADREPARRACEQYSSAVCERSVRCGAETLAECRATVSAELDCERVVGVKASLSTCLAELSEGVCGARPESCDELLIGE